VFPRNLIPQCKERVNFDFRAANGTTIRTYGWLTLRLSLGLRRDFMWRFVVADVTHPLIGADFLSHFGLLVDCQNNRLLDGTMSSAPIQAASSSIPSVKVSNGGTPVDSRPSTSSASQQAAPPTHGPPEISSGSSPSQSSYILAQEPPKLWPCLPTGRNAPGSGAPLPGPVSERQNTATPCARQASHHVNRQGERGRLRKHCRQPCNQSNASSDSGHTATAFTNPNYTFRPLARTLEHLSNQSVRE
jgi:hypothetical protein